jgi:leucyl-tRNA synthetase
MTTPTPENTSSQNTSAHRYTAAFANTIEPKWQQQWANDGTYRVPNPGEKGFDASRPKFYCLDMFPYPSGAGLHVGHPEGYTATDIICRYKRMRGHNVLHPMGWDAFGLPAEQYAIQTGVHPAITTRNAVDNFRRQLQRFGFCYDWSREFGTIDEDYYKWTQWIFLRLYNAWFNPWTNKAEPISTLEQGLIDGDILLDAFGELVQRTMPKPLASIFGATAATTTWIEMSEEDRREAVDSRRLAYQSETVVNWCPKLGTVLANDEVIDGRSERGGFPVLRKPLKQWMFRITAYADRLLTQIDALDWPESTKTMQREWIGRSEGAEIEFDLSTSSLRHSATSSLRVFTTRPDTIFGATYMVVAPEHELCASIVSGEMGVDAAAVSALKTYCDAARNRSEIERQESKEKTGVFTGIHAINPATGEKIPVWAADYVLMGYGTGAIMAVPGHDERDWEFAKKFKLPIVEVLRAEAHGSESRATQAQKHECFSGDGIAINSANAEVSLDSLPTSEAKKTIIAWLEKKGLGSRRVNFKLRDWTFSRQRYWGEPFPIVYDESGRAYPIMESHLPVKLPELADYAPVESDDPQPLLAKAHDWMHTTAAEAGVSPDLLPPHTRVARETNTMPGSAGSSWYAIRYCDPQNSSRLADKEVEQYWMGGAKKGVDLYLGGSEHAVGHLLYSRFWQNVLFDLGEVSTPEPFRKLFHQGLITSYAYQKADKTIIATDLVKEVSESPNESKFVEAATNEPVTPVVTKMSKRYKNVVNPDDVIAEFGADTFRLYEMYMGPLEASKPWNPRDITGLHRFLQRLWRVCVDEATGALKTAPANNPDLEKQLHRLIAKIGNDIERLSFNTAIAAAIEFTNACVSASGGGEKGTGALSRDQIERLALVVAPFTPHLSEELWSRLGNFASKGSIALQPWPVHDEAMLKDSEIEIPVSVLGKVRSRIRVAASADPKALEAAAMADETIQKLIAGKEIKKIIVVPGKMVNIVHG